ncbi:MAG: class II aldolase and adducin N-terminal domain-containing protein [Sedimentitalea sp.]
MSVTELRPNMDHWGERVDLAAAFRWTARLDLHEAVSNHFSLAVNDDGTRFLMNRNQVHFSRIRASELLDLDANDPDALSGPDAPDETAWALHAGIHRHCPHVRCAMHVHSIHATVLASLADSRLLPIDQNSAIFFNRHAVDDHYGGLALEEEGERCASMLQDPKVKVLVMANHGIMVTGDTVADTFNRLYFFERAAETYIRALQTGQPLRVLSDEIAEKTAQEVESYPEQADRHLSELKLILDHEGSDYAS